MIVNGNKMKIEIIAKEPEWGSNQTTKLFHDSVRRIDSISKDLDGSIFFQLSWEDVDSKSFSVSCNTGCAAIVVVWEHNDRQDNVIKNLKGQEWILKTEQQASWKKGYYGNYIYGNSTAVLSKKIEGGAIISFNRPANDLPLSVFVVQGMKNVQ